MKAIDVTELMDQLEMMIRIADALAQRQPYLPSVRKLRDKAERVLGEAKRALEPR